MEILIIIIAVSITLWFHNWNDEKHEHEQEKEFLIGIRNDSIKDSLVVTDDIKQIHGKVDYFDSLTVQISSNKFDKNYDDSLSNQIMTGDYLVYNDSRYESFKSSGNLRLIENHQLLLTITQYYNSMSFLAEADRIVYGEMRRDYMNQIGPRLHFINGNRKVSDILEDGGFQNFIYSYNFLVKERVRNKKDMIKTIEKIIEEIDTELKDRFDYDVSDKK